MLRHGGTLLKSIHTTQHTKKKYRKVLTATCKVSQVKVECVYVKKNVLFTVYT